jgi:SAM-dependent methyltransferase
VVVTVGPAERQARADACFAHRVHRWEALTGVATAVLLEALEPTPGELMLDVGCGAGAATLRAAELVGADGAMVGADTSAAVVHLASERAARVGVENVTFQVADLQTARVGDGSFSAVMSQFGVMFFDEPVAAFANIRRQLVSGGRLGFACWQAVAGANPWSYAALLADILPPPRARPGWHPPGPFSLGDASQLRAVLRKAGLGEVLVTPHQASVEVAEDVVVDDEELARMGVPPDHMTVARIRVRDHLAPYRTTSGAIGLPLAFLIATARSN